MNYKNIMSLFLGLLISTLSIHAEATKMDGKFLIPDDNFRAYLQKHIPQAFKGDYLLKNHYAVSSLKKINVKNMDIESLVGIEFFINLEKLNCSRNNLIKLDISKNINLTHLKCNSNALRKLDISRNIHLRKLNCNKNNLVILDISKNTRLEYLDCTYNELSTLNIDANHYLRILRYANTNIDIVDASNNPHLNSRYIHCEIKDQRIFPCISAFPGINRGWNGGFYNFNGGMFMNPFMRPFMNPFMSPFFW